MILCIQPAVWDIKKQGWEEGLTRGAGEQTSVHVTQEACALDRWQVLRAGRRLMSSLVLVRGRAGLFTWVAEFRQIRPERRWG